MGKGSGMGIRMMMKRMWILMGSMTHHASGFISLARTADIA